MLARRKWCNANNVNGSDGESPEDGRDRETVVMTLVAASGLMLDRRAKAGIDAIEALQPVRRPLEWGSRRRWHGASAGHLQSGRRVGCNEIESCNCSPFLAASAHDQALAGYVAPRPTTASKGSLKLTTLLVLLHAAVFGTRWCASRAVVAIIMVVARMGCCVAVADCDEVSPNSWA